VASFVWMLLTEPTYNRTRLTALAWRARNLSQKAPRNLSPFSTAPRFLGAAEETPAQLDHARPSTNSRLNVRDRLKVGVVSGLAVRVQGVS
jgi:hypothetical protein